MPTETTSASDPRGRDAQTPAEIPARGWLDILKRVRNEVAADNLAMIAAGLTFYLLLALFPGLAAAISIYGWVADPAQIQSQFEAFRGVVPAEVHSALTEEMERIAASDTAAGFGAVLGILFALWSASRGMSGLIQAMNIIYEEEERRGFFRLALVSIVFTIGAILMLAMGVIAIVVAPAVLGSVGLGAVVKIAVSWGRWALLLILAITALSFLYRFGPNRENARWSWISWGAVVATISWLLVSYLFSIYVANFGNYNKTYGSLGAVIVLMMWLFLSSFVVLLGGELNSELERQTAEDTTTGEPEPMGQRGAYMADTVAGADPDSDRPRSAAG